MLQYQEQEAARLCLKHLRQLDYDEAFSALQKKLCVQLEHPLLTSLHTALVDDGDYTTAENILEQIINS